MRLYVVRHGQTRWNLEGRAQGHTDVPLDEVGLVQANRVGESFRNTPVDLILSSDLQRAFDTAKAIEYETGARLSVRPDLRERCFGVWEGSSFTDFSTWAAAEANGCNESLIDIRPVGGESYRDLWNRLEDVHRLLNTCDQNLVVVSHGGACSMLLARLVLGSVITCRSFRFGNTAITELERRPDGFFSIVRYGDTSHLAC